LNRTLATFRVPTIRVTMGSEVPVDKLRGAGGSGNQVQEKSNNPRRLGSSV
jgi:hypothetical protein